MSLAPGTRLGPYEITGGIGAGGMGEVYRARDTTLQRDVAIKILREDLAHDTERLARFEREARTLASLNHPHIGQIHGLEESDGIKALVMELVEGPTLADRIAQGPIPLDESLPIARQIAEALEAAHERGIIHRDLKPANVKVRPDDIVKVLDFGLAKALELVSSDGTDAAASPTITSPAMMTRIGVILGTAAYMSPEQAKGRAADKRSDVWAFGCVLYEMVTGRRAFEGEDVSDTLAAVLRGEPDWTAVPEATPSPVVRLLRQCLEKDPKQRRRDIADVRLDLNDAARYAATIPMIGGNQAFGRARRRGLLVYGVPALVLGATLATVLSYALRPPDPIDAAGSIELSILPPPGTSFPLEAGAPWPSISPDGRQLAFVAVSAAGVQQLWIRPLESATARPLARSEGAARPFWSADSGAIGFFADGKIKRIDLPNGTPQVVCDVPYLGGMSATWSPHRVILFTQVGGFFRVPDSGGTPELVLPDRMEDGRRDSPQNPSFLPDGRQFVYVVQRAKREDDEICVASLESKEPPRCITKLASPARYAEPGYLLFVRDGALRLQPFSLNRLALTGEPTPVGASYVNVDPVYRPPPFSISARTLAFHPGTGISRLTWMDRQGRVLSTVGEADQTNAAVSRDGSHIVVSRGDREHPGNADLWQLDQNTGVWSKFTFDPAPDTSPVFSPDATRVVFARRHGGATELFVKPTSGLAAEAGLAMFPPGQEAGPQDWSADGRSILYGVYSAATSWDIGMIPATAGGRGELLLHSQYGERDGSLSPDMQWIAYDSTESGRREVWIQPMPPNGTRWQVSTGGGFSPRWRGDGRELFYLAAGGLLMAVPVTPGPTPVIGAATRLFQTLRREGGSGFAVSRDGQRFLINAAPAFSETDPITVIVDWRSAIAKH